jgi:hypothetical protein
MGSHASALASDILAWFGFKSEGSAVVARMKDSARGLAYELAWNWPNQKLMSSAARQTVASPPRIRLARVL